ncbi:MAG: DUF402 domain-containing protein [bacterium]|nr:DUF402 domain-containing protein [bacterium]
MSLEPRTMNRPILEIKETLGGATRISSQRVAWRDLVVDVLVNPDGGCRVLDEDQLPIDLDRGLRRRIESTRDTLCRDHARHRDDIEARTRAFMPCDPTARTDN